MKPPVYGLTGGIASGKSTVLKAFEALGIDCLDTDQLARDVIAPGTDGFQALEDAIGSQYFDDGALNRLRLRESMYQSPKLKDTVESVIHPLVRDAVNQWLESDADSAFRILCSPLLIETNQHAVLDGVIVVDLPETEQIKRGTQRDLRAKDTIEQIIKVQLPRDRRLEAATYIIDNSGDLDSLMNQVTTLHEQLQHD